jgi:hypothetical protein
LLLPELLMLVEPPVSTRAPAAVADKTDSEATPAPTVNMLAICRNLGICSPPSVQGSAEPAVTVMFVTQLAPGVHELQWGYA